MKVVPSERRRVWWGGGVAVAAFAAALVTVGIVSRAPAPPAGPAVVIVSIDGLRADAVTAARTPVLQRLLDEGAGTLGARTIVPSKTLPSHASMLTGTLPEAHGVLKNEANVVVRVAVPTIFELAKARGLRTAAFVAKAKLSNLARREIVDDLTAPADAGSLFAPEILAAADRVLRASRPDLAFVHFAEVDHAGHAFGWMSPSYEVALASLDRAVARLLEIAMAVYGPGGFTLIVTADHGGTDRDHGSAAPADVTIPWITWGRGVVRGASVGEVETMDTAATAMWLLGVPAPDGWAGEPIVEAYGDGAARR